MSVLGGIEFFKATVEAGSFATAARKLRVTPSAVSRRVAALERELGVQLLARTTRSLRLTDDGRRFHERCLLIVEQLGEARDEIAHAKGKPSGRLRVEVPGALGRTAIAPRLSSFLRRYPDLRVELILRDQFVDPVVEGADLLVRIGPLRDSPLIARRLGQSRGVLCASPGYVKKHGRPRWRADLSRHACLTYLRDGRIDVFDFDPRAASTVPTSGPFAANDEDVIRQLVLAGQGIAWLFDFLVAEDLAGGRLVRLLEDHPAQAWPIHALYPKNQHLLPRVRVFIDFLIGVFESAERA